MRYVLTRLCIVMIIAGILADCVFAQKAFTWEEVRVKFEAANPTLQAGQIGVDEFRAQETTAYLRPNPNLGLLADQIDPFNGGSPHGPFAYLLGSATVSYLHERQHKRELRLESAQKATGIATSSQTDLERNLIFNLRIAFVQALQEKAILDLAKENLAYYDHVLDVNRERYRAGGIAQVDLDRLEIQRVQYESDLQTAEVNLRTAKIQLLTLLNDRTPVDQFDVTGPFNFSNQLAPLDEDSPKSHRKPPRLEGRNTVCRQGKDRSQARHFQRVNRSHVRIRFRAQSAHRPILWRQREYSLANFRPESGRKAADRTGHQPQ